MTQLTIAEFADVVLENMRITKAARCVHEGGPTDLMPLVHVVDTNGRHGFVLIPDRDLIGAAVEQLREDGHRPLMIAFAADAYTREYPPEYDPEQVMRGDLQRKYEAGDMTVHEKLIVTAVEVRTMHVEMRTIGYSYGDDGMPTFGQPEPFEGEAMGQAMDNLKAAARKVRRR